MFFFLSLTKDLFFGQRRLCRVTQITGNAHDARLPHGSRETGKRVLFHWVVTSVKGYIVLDLVYWKKYVVTRRILLTSRKDNQSACAVNIINDTHGRKMAGCYISFGLHC